MSGNLTENRLIDSKTFSFLTPKYEFSGKKLTHEKIAAYVIIHVLFQKSLRMGFSIFLVIYLRFKRDFSCELTRNIICSVDSCGMKKHSRTKPDVQFKEFSLTKQKTRPKTDYEWIGKTI